MELSLEIKNINNLSINIFEINPESYYRKNLKELEPSIELGGLLPSKQINREFKQPPIIKFQETFKFEDITARDRGIFVIEFIGGGLSSRVMVRKGSLTLVTQETKAGLVVYVVNEEKKVCIGKDTGLLIDGKLRKVDDEGKILIPYQQSATTSTAIIIDNDYSELVHLSIP